MATPNASLLSKFNARSAARCSGFRPTASARVVARLWASRHGPNYPATHGIFKHGGIIAPPAEAAFFRPPDWNGFPLARLGSACNGPGSRLRRRVSFQTQQFRPPQHIRLKLQ